MRIYCVCLHSYRLIAIMLGRLEMTIGECIYKFVQYAGDIFSHPKHLIPLGTSVSLPKYNEKVLNHATQQLVSEFDRSSKDNQWRQSLFASSDVRTKTFVFFPWGLAAAEYKQWCRCI